MKRFDSEVVLLKLICCRCMSVVLIYDPIVQCVYANSIGVAELR